MRRTSLVVITASTVVAVLLAVFVNLMTDRWEPWILAVLVMLVVAAILVELYRTKPVVSDRRVGIDEAAGDLAVAVLNLWNREEEQQRIHDPWALPVRWRAASEGRMDHWAAVLGPSRTTVRPMPLTAEPNRIVDVYRRLPARRLVVLGAAGSGKTVLMLRFVLDLLQDPDRTTADPVPVIFSLGTWNPDSTSLRDWLAEQLIRDHPGLAAPGPAGSSLAATLVDADRILPVLDGFDEIAGGLRRAALDALNETGMPLLLTSRPEEYTDAVDDTRGLSKAAVVELRDLEFNEVADYLRSSARTSWNAVLESLPGNCTPSATNLTAVLSNPLMVMLARRIYSDSPDNDPAELLNADRFPTTESIENHLLSAFVPAIYRRQLRNPERAQQWLGHLSRHLNRTQTPNLAWWQLNGMVPQPARSLIVGLTVGLLIGFPLAFLGVQIYAAIAIGLLVAVPSGLVAWIRTGSIGRFLIGFGCGTIFGLSTRPLTGSSLAESLVIGFLFGSMIGLATGAAGGVYPEPSRIGLATTQARRPPVQEWILSGLSLVSIVLFSRILLGNGRLVTMGAVLLGLSIGLFFGIMLKWLRTIEIPVDISAVPTPANLLTVDRRNSITQANFVGLVLASVLSAAMGQAGQAQGFGFVIAVGVFTVLAFALVRLSGSAWGRWIILVRVWLPLRGRLPWRVMGFLDEAHRLGVLRQVGAVYQFRHARLQERLAEVGGRGGGSEGA